MLDSLLGTSSNPEWVIKGCYTFINNNTLLTDSPDSWYVYPGMHAWTLNEYNDEHKYKQQIIQDKISPSHDTISAK